MAGPAAAAPLMRTKSTLPARPRFAKLPAFAESMAPGEAQAHRRESPATARALRQPADDDGIATRWSETRPAILAQQGPTKPLLDDLVRQVNAILPQE